MSYGSTAQPINILLVEDSEADVRLTLEVLTESKVHNNLLVATNGKEAMEGLRKRGRYGESPRPDLILLDLNMPVMDGRECWRKSSKTPT